MAASAQGPRDLGIKFFQEGSFADSVEYLLQAVVEDPSDVDAYLYLAVAYARQGDFDKAVSVLEQAVDVAPTSAKVHYNLGVAYQRAHNLTLAKDEYTKAVGLDPGYVAAKQALEAISKAEGSSQQL